MSTSKIRQERASHAQRQKIVERLKNLGHQLCDHLNSQEAAGKAIRECLETMGLKGPTTDRPCYTKLQDMTASVRYTTSELQAIEDCLNNILATAGGKPAQSADTPLPSNTNPDAMITPSRASSNLSLIVPELAETILPHFFQFVYQVRQPIEITTEKHWGNFGERFENDETEVVIHSFSTVLAHNQAEPKNQLLFFPLFAFHGYELVVSAAHLKSFARKARKPQNGQGIQSWKNAERRSLIASSRILVEHHTDFEWFFRKVCREYGFNEDNKFPEEVLEDVPSPVAQRELLGDPKQPIILPTNVLTVSALHNQKRDIVTPLYHKVKHKNYDGFICKEAFFREHEDEVAKLIWCWFETRKILIHSLLLEKDRIHPHGFEHLHQDTFIKVLQKISDWDLMRLADVKKIYDKKYCTYFPGYKQAVEEFRKDVLTSSTIKANHEEIAQMLLDGEKVPENWAEGYQVEFDNATERVMAKLGSYA